MSEKPCWKTLSGMIWGAFRWSFFIAAALVAGALWLKAWWPLILAILVLGLDACIFLLVWRDDNSDSEEEEKTGSRMK